MVEFCCSWEENELFVVLPPLSTASYFTLSSLVSIINCLAVLRLSPFPLMEIHDCNNLTNS